MSKKALLFLAPVLSALPFLPFGTRALWIPYWPCPPKTVYAASWCCFSGLECVELEDLKALNRALARGDPLPPGYSASAHRSHEIARTTGSVDWFGRHEIALVVGDAMENLRSARLYLDDELVDEADWENGQMTDLSDEAQASFRFFLPWRPPFTVKLITENWDGREDESSLTIGHVARK